MKIVLKLFTLYKIIYIKFNTLKYKILLKNFGRNSRVYGKIHVINPENIIIGNNVTLNEGVFLNARSNIIIGNNVRISPYVIINTGSLDVSGRVPYKHTTEDVVIHDNVWLASNAIINPGVTVNKGSVVGAGSVVNKDVPANVFAAGVPAKPIKNL